jgi:hypothetical protein
VQNSGVELALNTVNIKSGKFTWSSSINLTIPRNSLIAFPGLATSGYATSLEIGEPITTIHAYNYLGVNPGTGLYEFLGKDKNITSNPSYPLDATRIFNYSPVLYGGFSNSLQFKDFQLDFLFSFVEQKSQNYFYGALPGAYYGGSTGGSQPTSVLQSWKNPGDQRPIQVWSAQNPNSILNSWEAVESSSAAWTNASYIRLKNVSLSWELPKTIQNKAHIKGWRIYILAQNLLTITNYYGLDPETGSSTFALPPLRVLTFGTQITF